MSKPLIELERVSFRIEGQTILREVSLCLNQGDRLAIIGPNGSGKSTLLKMLSREIYPSKGSGEVRIAGAMKASQRELRTKIVTVSPDLEAKLIHDPTVLELVLSGPKGTLGIIDPEEILPLPPGREGVPVEAGGGRGIQQSLSVPNLLEEWGLSNLKHRKISTLSSGERRRAWIARALAIEPTILLLDEPTTNLDPQATQDLLNRISKLTVGALVMVTHNLEEISEAFNRVITIEAGKVVSDAPRYQTGRHTRPGREKEGQPLENVSIQHPPPSRYIGTPPPDWEEETARQIASPSQPGGSTRQCRGREGDNEPPKTPESPCDFLAVIQSSPVYDVAIVTPFEFAPTLSQHTNNKVWLKREDRQPTFSFKVRGAYAFMSGLTKEQLKKGVIAASAGNHAQGVALAAQKLDCKATIVVPVTTPTVKQDAIRDLGAHLILEGENYDAASQHAANLAKETGATLVHPYDHPAVIAGQGTVGLEIHEQAGPLDAVFVAVGGGGLISGVALALKQLRPGIKVIGVEPEDSDAMHRSLAAGEPITLPKVGVLADGVAVRRVGDLTFKIVQEWVDEVVVVSNDEICAAVREIFEDCRAVLEPSGALAYAGLKHNARANKLQNQNLAAIACGANLNFDRLRYISERAMVGLHREAVLAVTIPEQVGSFRRFCEAIGDRSITEFNYRLGNAKEAHVFVGIGVRGEHQALELVQELENLGYPTLDLSKDELATTHLRHMVGGRAAHAEDERLFHFDFPERAGALSRFLQTLGDRFNISLFHYRNHGADRGRVLVGFQVPPARNEEFGTFLTETRYEYLEVTTNPGLRLFI